MLTNQFRHAFPDLGIDVVTFSIYYVGEFAYNNMSAPSHSTSTATALTLTKPWIRAVSTAPISVPLAVSTAPASAPVLVSTSFPSIPSTAPLPSVHHTETASEGETSMTQSVEVEASVTLVSLIDPNISSFAETVPVAASSEVATVPVAESEINIATSDVLTPSIG
ncbi:uncharacterized protein [Nicotiana sylvestris]|uniref:uncharacterized protein n=1 Tax=Nicotiana sylvestris TaxID=4096 RepID=UPI00388C6A58